MKPMDDLAKEFITETLEGMDQFDKDLLTLEKDPSDHELLSGIFRVVHTIKGACGFLGFIRLQSLAHAGEGLLSNLRDGNLVAGKQVISCLFRLSDAIREIIGAIEKGGSEGAAENSALIGELTAWKPDWVGNGSAAPAHGGGPIEEPHARLQEPAESGSAPKDSHHAERTIRVDVALLDKLMNLVGELVLVRNQVLRYTQLSGNSHLSVPSQHLNLITTELQEGVMKTRMQPIRNVWGKFPRVVRELSLACGKQVRVDMEGEETELDKTILEAIKDPLTHVLRNSVDHGIETPEERRSRGKPPEGRIFLKAFHEGGQVILEISDDGAGVDIARVVAKALDRGLVSSESMAKMADRELAQLIFLPGFSTAERITTVSGRGVGMDVVRTHIERIGGAVELHNRPGLGLTLRVKIPLTLAIIPALIVETRDQRFAIPQVNVLEVVRLKDDVPGQGVEWIEDAPVYRLRNKLLPLARTERLLGMAGEGFRGPDAPSRDNFVVVLQAEEHHFGILVQTVHGTQEIVVKPLSKHLKSSLFAGATIMGDGRVALIMDIPGLAQEARLTPEFGEESSQSRVQGPADSGRRKERMVIVGFESHGLMAIPLADVSRLQEFQPDSIETMADMEVIQSRGRILPLVRLGGLLEGRRPAADSAGASGKETLSVVVFTEGEASAGFIVDRILDIVDVDAEVHMPASKPGFIGGAIIQGRATEILDLSALAKMALPALFPGLAPAGLGI